MKKITLPLVLMLVTSISWTQDVEKKVLKGEPSPTVTSLKLTVDLVKYGYSQQSPLPLIDTLQIIFENPTQPLNAQREGTTVDTSKMKGNQVQFL